MRCGITVPAIGTFSHPKTTVEMAVEAEATGGWGRSIPGASAGDGKVTGPSRI
ncbi:MAG: hypothetical protein WCY97_11090 [Methanothrix sp.]|nr:hypothetical protein [Methanothrix sp.]MDD5767810.1 hypothetical protein [Methanothrix sp.]MDI9398574.1 hypothetical protein [Euryarchaeota archaeon]